MRSVCVGVAVLLAGCALVEKSVGRGVGQAMEAVVGIMEGYQSLALSLSLPGLAVADRIESGEWPTPERLDELLKRFPVESFVCEVSVVAATDLEYHIQFGLIDPASERCSYTFAATARYVEAPELCYQSLVWPIAPTAQDPAELQADIICQSTLSNVPISWHLIFPARSGMDDAAQERTRQRLREALELTPVEGQ